MQPAKPISSQEAHFQLALPVKMSNGPTRPHWGLPQGRVAVVSISFGEWSRGSFYLSELILAYKCSHPTIYSTDSLHNESASAAKPFCAFTNADIVTVCSWASQSRPRCYFQAFAAQAMCICRQPQRQFSSGAVRFGRRGSRTYRVRHRRGGWLRSKGRGWAAAWYRD